MLKHVDVLKHVVHHVLNKQLSCVQACSCMFVHVKAFMFMFMCIDVFKHATTTTTG